MQDAILAPSLGEAYREHFLIGAAVNACMLRDEQYRRLIGHQFTSMTAENEMKPERLLDREATLALADPVRCALRFDQADRMLAFAGECGIRVRFHTLVWHNQTPRWFFAEGWSDAPDAPLADAETVLARQEAYILQVMEHVNRAFPGLVYCWDVVNEAVETTQGGPDGLRTRSLWYRAAGPAFLPHAFRAARKGRAEGQLLFYNDYNSYFPDKREAILKLLADLQAEGLVDGMGMQTHMDLSRWDLPAFESGARAYINRGLDLHVTEMDIHCPGADEESQASLAKAYGGFFAMLLRLEREGAKIGCATLWGVTDRYTWLRSFRKQESYPLLFSGDLKTKPAFDSVMDAVKAF
ncbi:MAG: endo-1,4-beta-xylanase [Clostridia bacterium]|nr:endo-1,4-beta-xylanase [Clostridia bacterium]